MNTRQLSLIIVFLACAFPAQLTAQVVPLSMFRDSVLPPYGCGDLYDITTLGGEYYVSSSNDSLLISTRAKSRSDRDPFVFPMRNGQLIGIDHGEFGGALIYEGNDGIHDTIANMHTEEIFSCGGEIYFTNNYSHMNWRYGNLCRLDTTNRGFHVEVIARFDHRITAHVTKGDTMYIVSDGKLYRMDNKQAVFLAGCPYTTNSMAIIGRYMYFGMNGAYARLDLQIKEQRYFVYTGK